MLKTTPSILAKSSYTRPNENDLNTNNSGSIGGKGIKNLSIIKNLTKSKNLDFIKTKTSGADFLTPRAKEAFIHL